MVADERQNELGGWACDRLPRAVSIRTLALLTRSLGAKLGANDHRHEAAAGHVRPISPQLEPTSGDTRRHRATKLAVELGKLSRREDAPSAIEEATGT